MDPQEAFAHSLLVDELMDRLAEGRQVAVTLAGHSAPLRVINAMESQGILTILISGDHLYRTLTTSLTGVRSEYDHEKSDFADLFPDRGDSADD